MLADLRMALRRLRRAPGYVAVVVATLGLGIGGVTAVFTLADPMIFRPLPYADPDRIVEVRARVPDSDVRRLHADDFVAIAERSRTLDDVATLTNAPLGRFRGSPDLLPAGGISSDFLRLTGLQPVLGRVFFQEEYERDPQEPPSVAMFTWSFWQTAFGGATDVIGSRLDLDGPRPFSMEIVGVLPREFFYPQTANQAPAFIVPGKIDPWYFGRANAYPTVLARVRPEYTFAQAEAELDLLLADVERANPTFKRGRKARVIPLQELLFVQLRTPLLLLFTATGCLLVIALVNLMHLAGARARLYAPDLTVRASLGAGRWRMIRPLMAEAVVLAALGAAAGLIAGSLLFSWGIAQTSYFDHVYRLLPAGQDARVFVFTAGIAAIAILAIGLWPALSASRRRDLRTQRAISGRRRAFPGERLVIVTQTAFAVGLVVICLLVVRSFTAIVGYDRGLDPGRVLLARVDLPETDSPAALAEHHRRLAEALNDVRGVEAAAVGNGVPMLNLTEPLVDVNGESVPNVIAYQVSGRFAATMGMHLEEGRLFDDAEAFGAAPVAVVDRTTAEAIWPGEQALGKVVRLRSGRELVVVGVLKRVRMNYSISDTPRGVALVSIDTTEPRVASQFMPVLRLDARWPATDAALAAAARHAVPGLEWRSTVGMAGWERFVGQPRFLAAALGLLATLTVLLAGFGVLGVVSHLVSRRTPEIGTRIALGATRQRVRMLVVRQAILPAVAGVGAGLLLAYWWSASVRSAVVGISLHDPWSFAGAAAATLATVVIASLWPAARASRIDPAATLRAE